MSNDKNGGPGVIQVKRDYHDITSLDVVRRATSKARKRWKSAEANLARHTASMKASDPSETKWLDLVASDAARAEKYRIRFLGLKEHGAKLLAKSKRIVLQRGYEPPGGWQR